MPELSAALTAAVLQAHHKLGIPHRGAPPRNVIFNSWNAHGGGRFHPCGARFEADQKPTDPGLTMAPRPNSYRPSL
jgi:hypothetical protein